MIKVVLLIIGLHIFADFTLQGILADLKQKDYWVKLFKDGSTWISYEGLIRKYGNDYKVALLCHSIYWTLITFAPIIYLSSSDWFIVSLVSLNTLVHYVVDDQKANAHTINLIHDQIAHIAQISITIATWALWFGT